MSVGSDYAEQIVQQARALVGTPFFHAGREAGVGIDCVGLILLPAWNLGISRYRPPNYSQDFDRELLVQCLSGNLERIDRNWKAEDYYAEGAPEALLADVLLFATRGHPAHLAYKVSASTMVHCDSRGGGVVEVDISAHWMKLLISAWRWPVCQMGRQR